MNPPKFSTYLNKVFNKNKRRQDICLLLAGMERINLNIHVGVTPSTAKKRKTGLAGVSIEAQSPLAGLEVPCLSMGSISQSPSVANFLNSGAKDLQFFRIQFGLCISDGRFERADNCFNRPAFFLLCSGQSSGASLF